MKAKIILTSAIAALALNLGAAQADEWDHLAIVDKIDSAKAELKKAKALGFEWRDTGKLLKKAEKASKAGDYDKAQKLIAKARKQAQLAVIQAADQHNAGPRKVY